MVDVRVSGPLDFGNISTTDRKATEAAMTAVDRLGFHLRLKTNDGMKGTRINFLREVHDADETRKELVEMVRAAEPKA